MADAPPFSSQEDKKIMFVWSFFLSIGPRCKCNMWMCVCVNIIKFKTHSNFLKLLLCMTTWPLKDWSCVSHVCCRHCHEPDKKTKGCSICQCKETQHDRQSKFSRALSHLTPPIMANQWWQLHVQTLWVATVTDKWVDNRILSKCL